MLPQGREACPAQSAAEATIGGGGKWVARPQARCRRHSSTPETSVAEMSMGELRRIYLV